MKLNINKFSIELTLPNKTIAGIKGFFERHAVAAITIILSILAIAFFVLYYQNGFGVAYNDARSHLNIGRRVVEGLKPGLAQIGSVWLPLPHFLMIPTIWNDFFWHSGLSGAIQSMVSFVLCGVIIYKFLDILKVGIIGKITAIAIFSLNLNVLYLQSTAMTELLLLFTMTAGSYYLLLWFLNEKLFDFIKAAFFVFISTTIRYDGWFLLIFSLGLIALDTFKKKGYKQTEGTLILFSTLAGFGIVLWLFWNLLIFKDPLYFAFGPFSAYAQQEQIKKAGELLTKGNIVISIKAYLYSLAYNTYTFPLVIAFIGFLKFMFDSSYQSKYKYAILALISPLFFNIIALYFGHSILTIPGIYGKYWWNIRYGLMMMPAVAIFIGYLIDRLKHSRAVIIGLVSMVYFFSFVNKDIVTLDDALYGASGRNISEVSSWLNENTLDKKGFIMISTAFHDAIVFSSGLPMKRFITEGTGKYWEYAGKNPEKWTRWIIMRTYDMYDLTSKELFNSPNMSYYDKIKSYDFADIYQLKEEYVSGLITEPILGKQK